MSDEPVQNIAIEAADFRRADTAQARRILALKPLPVAIGIIFVTLLLAVVFLLTARAVSITTVPPTPDITISGFSYELGGRYLMLSGEYQLGATAPGYYPLDTTLTVTEDADQDYEFTLTKLPGRLSISTQPPVTAEVYIDQRAVGVTPLADFDVPAGIHDINLLSDRFLPYQTEIEIEGRRVQQAIEAELTPAWADIGISSSPVGAEILVNGEVRGTTPITLEILQGQRQLQVRKPGYKIWQSDINVRHGEAQQLPEIVLQLADGEVSIASTPAGANVTIGDRYYGQTPLSVKLAPGTFSVELTKAGFETASTPITVKADEDMALDINLQPVQGVINLSVQPADAELYIDGQLIGPANRQLVLTASRHDVEIRKPGFATYRTTVTPQPDFAQQLMVNLMTTEQAAIAAIPTSITTGHGQSLQLILPGEFQMGAGRRERGRRSNEIVKDVKLTRAYYIGVHEVTNKEYKQVFPSHDPGFFGRALLNADPRPVVNVAWSDAVQYCNALSRQDGLAEAYRQIDGRWELITPVTTGYRLPTEAEWVWASRYANDEPSRFPWGDNLPPPPNHGNYADETALNMVPYYIADYNDRYRGPAPVGTFSANQYGLYDLSGNASEWVNDYYSVAMVRGLQVDPLGPESGDHHVIRGSNYTQGRFSELRWAYRDYGSEPRKEVGFRLARYVE